MVASPDPKKVSWASSPHARSTMRANRGRDTTPELAVRRLVHGAGLRFRVNARPETDLRRTVDLLFRRSRVVVLIDGCFWHGCPQHHQAPRTNAQFWSDKIRRNRERDAETDRILAERGWSVMRFWEHEVRTDVDRVAAEVIAAVRSRSRPSTEHGVEDCAEEA